MYFCSHIIRRIFARRIYSLIEREIQFVKDEMKVVITVSSQRKKCKRNRIQNWICLFLYVNNKEVDKRLN